ncbi:cyclopropane-fatty-acyl-phospholipid synthase family protein [Cyclobacteriaceae bacterium]|nr:cyclopropane-fatty-acyl-phospholipid synthase family protein [Cyclobacteriaceae bacterium]
MWYLNIVEKNIIPDWLIRLKIRHLLKSRLRDEYEGSNEGRKERFMDLIDELKSSPIAVNTIDANEQHYEVPTAFYQLVMGDHLKYSCGYWKDKQSDQNTSEKDMLEITTKRAELTDNQTILELGCGWGSLTLFMAEKYPGSNITAVSNSRTQKEFIDSKADERGLKNIEVITADMNDFEADKIYDRVVSVEMFEHMRNYQKLLLKVNQFLKDEGKLFVHIFSHKELSYKFEVKDDTDWMSKYFFTGGIMPSDHLFHYFNEDLLVKKHWTINGTHYEKTSNNWLARMDQNKERVMAIFKDTYGSSHATKWWVYWRLFFMSCAELWGYNKGEEWVVSHYLFEKSNKLQEVPNSIGQKQTNTVITP